MKLEFQRRDLVLFGANAALTIVLVLGLILGGGTTGPQGLSGTQGPSGPVGPIGSTGAPGEDGIDGEDGLTPYIGENGNWWVGETDTGIQAEGGQGGSSTSLDFDAFFNDFRLSKASETYATFKAGGVTYVNEPDAAYASGLIAEGYIAINNATNFFTELSGDTVGKRYVLTSDISFANSEWDTLPNFQGTLDGAGYALDGLTSENFAGLNNAEISLFETLTDALVVNLVIKNFVIEQSDLFGFNGFAGLLARNIQFSTVANVTIVDNLYKAARDVGLVASNAYDSNFFDLTLIANTLIAQANLGGVVAYTERSIFAGILVESNHYSAINGVAGGVVGVTYESVLMDVSVIGSTLTFMPLDLQLNPIYDSSLVVARAYFSTLYQVLLSDGSIIFSNETPPDNYQYPSAYNLGGVVGLGDEVILMDVLVEKENLEPFFDLRTLINNNVFEIEYIGGVAGFLTNYYLINVVNQADVILIDTLGEWANINDVAGIVGYSAGSGYYHQVVNYGDVIGTFNVGGILGGVGFAFVPAFGFIHLQQVANYGFILGNDNVGGLIGNLDGSTSLVLTNAINHSLVVGNYAVGGLIGLVVMTPQVNRIEIANAFVFGQVFGVQNVGGILGQILSIDGSNALPQLRNLLVYAEVEGMFLGFVDFPRIVSFYGSPGGFRIGTVIGSREFPLVANHVLSIAKEVTKAMFEFNGDATDTVLTGNTITGYYNPLGFGAGAGFVSIPENEDALEVVQFFLNDIFDDASAFEVEDALPFLADFPLPLFLTQFDRGQQSVFFKPYLLATGNPFFFPL